MQPRLPLSCVLLDLDGTLVDTTSLIFESYRHTLQAVLGYTPTDDELLGQYGRPLPDTMRQLVTALGRTGGAKIEAATETDVPAASIGAQAGGVAIPDPALVDKLVKIYRKFNTRHHDEFIRSFPDVSETLAELRRRGYTLGLVTSKGRRTTELSLRHYGLRAYLDTTVTADDTTIHKPHPAPILKALENMDKQAAEALFVGDSVHDIMAGQVAGVLTAAALWGPFPREDLAALHPNYMLERITDVLTICPPRVHQS